MKMAPSSNSKEKEEVDEDDYGLGALIYRETQLRKKAQAAAAKAAERKKISSAATNHRASI